MTRGRKSHPPKHPRTFGELLAVARLKAGLTQQALADRLGSPVSTIGGMECGINARPTLRMVLRLAKALGCQPVEIIPERE